MKSLDLSDPNFSTRSIAVAEARESHWAARTPYGLAVLRYREVGQLLRDRRLRQGSYAWPKTNGLTGPFADFWTRSVIGREGTAHRNRRDLAVPALSPDFVVGLKPSFDRIASGLCDTLRTSTVCEFQNDFAVPFARQAIAALLGIDTADWRKISRDASDLGLAMGVESKRYEPIFDAAYLRLNDLARELVAQARQGVEPDSYVARVVSRYDASEGTTETDLLDMIVITIFGGVDTTSSQLGLGMSLFIDHPEQWQLLRRDPALVPNAIEEIIQMRPTTTWVTREALEDFEFGGEQIAQGTLLHLLVHASARDPTICDAPAFDITVRRKKHFGFGGGAHHCIGHLVARTDMACAFTALARTISSMESAGPAEWMPDSGNTSPIRLPIRYQIA